MKKVTSVIGILIYLFVVTPLSYAVSVCPTNDFQNLCSIDIEKNSSFLGNIFSMMLVAAVLLSLGFLIFGGIKWIMSGGDKGKLDSARGTIVASIVGLVISFFAFSIVSIVGYIFGVGDVKSMQLPRLVSTR